MDLPETHYRRVTTDGENVVVGDTVSFGHYRQEGVQLKDDKRVKEVVRDIAEVILMEKEKEKKPIITLFDRHQQYTTTYGPAMARKGDCTYNPRTS